AGFVVTRRSHGGDLRWNHSPTKPERPFCPRPNYSQAIGVGDSKPKSPINTVAARPAAPRPFSAGDALPSRPDSTNSAPAFAASTPTTFADANRPKNAARQSKNRFAA